MGRRGLVWVLGMAVVLGPASPRLCGADVVLDSTPYEAVAERYDHISARLLYALTLQESQRLRSADKVSPWPWVLRTPQGPRWYDSRAAAREALGAALERWSHYRIDVGAAQINLGWHAARVAEPAELLSLQHNLEIAAEILAEALESTDDPVLGIGRYHTWSDTERARTYGHSVLTLAQRIAATNRGAEQWMTN